MNFTARENSLLSNTDVLGYIQAKNAERDAQAKAEGWEFWTLMPEGNLFVAEFANVYELEMRYARGTYSDVYKEWCGIRPSIPQGLTLTQLEAEIEQLSEMAAESHKADLEWQAEMDRQDREAIAMGLAEPTEETELEQWEIYEAKAEAEGY